MTHDKATPQSQNIAVFTRNYEQHLAKAVERCQADPASQVLFRSSKRWRAAANAITRDHPIPIYFVPVNSTDGLITYVARLLHVELEPERLTEEEVRGYSVETTKDEGDWEKGVKTFYFISNCRKLAPSEQIHFTELRKKSDGEPIAGNYHYNYVIVRPHPTLAV